MQDASRVPNLGLRVPNPRKHPVYIQLYIYIYNGNALTNHVLTRTSPIYIYIYIYMCVCVCMTSTRKLMSNDRFNLLPTSNFVLIHLVCYSQRVFALCCASLEWPLPWVLFCPTFLVSRDLTFLSCMTWFKKTKKLTKIDQNRFESTKAC